MHRTYIKDELAVFWDSEKCFHSRRCVGSSAKIFDPLRRPWIDLSQAEMAEIWECVSKCPSGALTCAYTHGIEVRFEEDLRRSAAYDGGKLVGTCLYREDTEGWSILSTHVDPSCGGQGIAKRLVYSVTEAAERRRQKVLPVCSYAVKVLAKNGPEEQR